MARRSLAGLAILASCVSCGSSPRISNAAPPTVICGKTISNSPAGAVIDNATTGDLTIDSVTVGNLLFLHVASGCRSGADVAIDPSDAASVVDDVKASDGRLVVVVLQPHRNAFTVRVTRSPTSVSVVTVQGLSVETPPPTP